MDTFIFPTISSTLIKRVKVVMLGAEGVGKSSLATRFVKNSFQDCHKATVGATFLSRTLDVDFDGEGAGIKKVTFEIWDTAGQERFRSLVPMYYRDADIALLVYDITNSHSLAEAEKWIGILRSCRQEMLIVLVENKIDCDLTPTQEREEMKKQARMFTRQNALLFFETSARSGEGVEDLFIIISRLLKYSGSGSSLSIKTLQRRPESKYRKCGCS